MDHGQKSTIRAVDVVVINRGFSMKWIKVSEVAPPIEDKFLGWHEAEGAVICGAFIGSGWTDEAIKENLRLKRFTHWAVIEEPEVGL